MRLTSPGDTTGIVRRIAFEGLMTGIFDSESFGFDDRRDDRKKTRLADFDRKALDLGRFDGSDRNALDLVTDSNGRMDGQELNVSDAVENCCRRRQKEPDHCHGIGIRIGIWIWIEDWHRIEVTTRGSDRAAIRGVICTSTRWSLTRTVIGVVKDAQFSPVGQDRTETCSISDNTPQQTRTKTMVAETLSVLRHHVTVPDYGTDECSCRPPPQQARSFARPQQKNLSLLDLPT
ncbi:hypothetical protein B0T18DRAFT_17374 [Schizothecium vesticola]|uniref:Uncharacterized protein n=1 Tax=Schizothecium vesticola TaxID=314040 RepID=A0AA40KC96_9PEZI|nr:hypothetical protein B0T18DRAFT_17374 [Schizothecium vesticola]